MDGHSEERLAGSRRHFGYYGNKRRTAGFLLFFAMKGKLLVIKVVKGLSIVLALKMHNPMALSLFNLTFLFVCCCFVS